MYGPDELIDPVAVENWFLHGAVKSGRFYA